MTVRVPSVVVASVRGRVRLLQWAVRAVPAAPYAHQTQPLRARPPALKVQWAVPAAPAAPCAHQTQPPARDPSGRLRCPTDRRMPLPHRTSQDELTTRTDWVRDFDRTSALEVRRRSAGAARRGRLTGQVVVLGCGRPRWRSRR